MFVAEGAVESSGRNGSLTFFDSYIRSMTEEAKKLGLTKQEIIRLIERGFEE